jgi:propanol-preferring alcohol dehydrogenase
MSRAYRLLGAGCAEMVDVPRPEPGPDEVLLRVLAAGVCRTDLALLRGGGADGVTLPVTLGHEVVGEVVALGEGLSAPQRGAVMAVLRAARLRRVLRVLAGEHNVAGTSSRGRSAALETAAWPTHVVVPARSLVAVGDVDPVHAAPLTDAGMTALHAVERGRALLEPGAVAVVVGIGGLGHLAVQLLRAMSEVPGTRRRRRPRAPGLRRGDRRRDGIAAGPGAAEDVLAANGGRKVDAVFDFVGTQESLDLAAEVTRRGGGIVVTGGGGGRLSITARMGAGGAPDREIAMVHTFGGTRGDLARALALAEAGRVRTHVAVHDLAAAGRVLADLDAGNVLGRAVLVP